MSVTSLLVGTIDSLKKLMTTELNLSRSSGYRLKDDYGRRSRDIQRGSLRSSSADATHCLDQELTQNPDQFVVDELTTSQRRLFQSSDLLFDDDFERGSAYKERRGRTLEEEREDNGTAFVSRLSMMPK